MINFAQDYGDKIRTIRLFRSYYIDFYIAQAPPVREKINYVLKLLETQQNISTKFFKYLQGSDGIYEVRVEYGGNIFRIFCCMDEGAVVILFHGIQKKTQKTPLKEIKKAERIKKEYFKSKEEDK